ncbi:hypothetical protein ACE2AJ_02015 [Aquihabitans daechungensis]|uniref:hypothetical protein n=1 Tax=Aquihabitans daechungensis TaxID=1052257 RepID=UPI003B9EB498
MVDVRAPRKPSSPNEEEGPYRMGLTWGRGLAIGAVVLMIIFWVWIFSGAPAKDNPDRIRDEAYLTELEDQCQGLRDDLDELPNAADLDTAAQRADVLDDANVLVGGFIEELEAGAPTSGDAAVTMEGWITDWKTYLANREDYAERLRTDPGAQLLLDRSKLGDSVDKTIQIFTQVNEIPACETPGDVG